jgi:thiol:disulfide interchange protein
MPVTVIAQHPMGLLVTLSIMIMFAVERLGAFKLRLPGQGLSTL